MLMKKKELPHFFKASAILALAAVVGVCVNISNLYHTYEYSKETMRGKSELKQEGPLPPIRPVADWTAIILQIELWHR